MSQAPVKIEGSKILVVDDTPANLDLFSQILEAEGYKVSYATNGKQALKLAALDPPDLILLDIMMPDMDGIEACRQLKSLKKTREIPVIFVTAKTDRQDVADGFKVGCVDYISKPVKQEEVCARIRCHLVLQALIRLRDELIGTLCEHNSRIEDLVREQDKQLQQAEKLAAIGDMVGEFTHEINSPVGVAVTAASHLQQQIKILAGLFETGQLRESDFSRFLETCEESVEMVGENLQRAIRLIESFKRVTVDQCSERVVRFDLRACLGDIILSMQPKLRRTRHRLLLHCDDGLFICSYPGVFAQILINLINNSLLHGLVEGVAGEMEIRAELNADELLLSFRDNGKGVAEDQQARIFEKYYSTRPDKGGSGLGLHIVRTLVQDRLGGDIRCHSLPEQGCRFEIRIPWVSLQGVAEGQTRSGEC